MNRIVNAITFLSITLLIWIGYKCVIENKVVLVILDIIYIVMTLILASEYHNKYGKTKNQ